MAGKLHNSQTFHIFDGRVWPNRDQLGYKSSVSCYCTIICSVVCKLYIVRVS